MKDLTGKRFGRLVAKKIAGRNKSRQILWQCVCDCGGKSVSASSSLINGHSKSCGCLKIEKAIRTGKKKLKDLTGKRFMRLIVLKCVGRDNHKQAVWKCRCDCGNITEVRGGCLRSGNTQSCGCLFREESAKRSTTHGLYYGKDGNQRRLYGIYSGMKDRCLNKRCVAYKYYGGRGISICKEWLDDFETFHNWAIQNGYHKKLSIERIDNDGDYEPINCTWIPRQSQNKNKSTTIRIEFNGENLTLSEWSERTGISYCALYLRVKRYNWPIEKILTTPNRKINKKQGDMT